MEMVITICMAIAGLGLPLLTIFVLSRPFRLRASTATSRARRLTLIDIVALMIQIQLALFVSLSLSELATDAFSLPSSLLVLSLIIWWISAESAARSSIRKWQHRLMLHLVLVPGIIGVALSSIACFAAIVIAALEGLDSAANPWTIIALISGTLLGGAILYALGAWICRCAAAQELPPRL